jgi:hypothetical protein
MIGLLSLVAVIRLSRYRAIIIVGAISGYIDIDHSCSVMLSHVLSVIQFLGIIFSDPLEMIPVEATRHPIIIII